MARAFSVPIIGQSAASGAQVIDGSLKFDGNKQHYLTRTPSSSGNLKTWTWSGWVKRLEDTEGVRNQNLWSVRPDSPNQQLFRFENTNYLRIYLEISSSVKYDLTTNAVFREFSGGWYHIVLAVDSTQATDSNRVKLYINGTQETSFSSATYPSLNQDGVVNSANTHYIAQGGNSNDYFTGQLSNVYLIDGQALDASEFGFTDPLTNTWKPKKYTGTFGTNGFYLPMNGNLPVTQDQSGNGNHFTPSNLGGTVDFGNPRVSGALPILNTIQGGTQAGVGVRTDTTVGAAATCVLALPLLGSSVDFSNKIDSKSTTKTITNNGNAAASGAESNFYDGSFYFDGTGDYIITTADTDEMVINTQDFTLEAWIWNDQTGAYQGILSDRPDGGGGTSINITNGNKIEYYAGGTIYNTTFNVPQKSWHHVALTRQSGTMYSFWDGQLLDSSTATNDNGDNAGIWNIGRYYYNRDGYYYKGYVQDARIYQGVAKYTSDFVVPSTKPDILPDTPMGVSGNSKLTKVTSGAVKFDGSSYLEVTSSTDFAFGTGDFTLEAYIYATSLPNTNNRIFCSGAGGAGDRTNFQLMVGSAGYLEFAHTTNYQTANGLIGTNRWYHVAATREGTSLKMFIDGVLQHTGTSSVNVTENGGVTIGREFGYSSYFNGFISNARILKGTALYTANFTPPTEPLTNVTNTKLLCCQSNISANLATISPATFSNDGRFYSREVSFSPEVLNNVRGNDKAFTGQIPNNASSSSNNPASLTVSFSSNLTSVTSLKIFSGSNSSNAYINGASGSTVSITASSWTDLTSLATGASGTISSITVLTGGDNAQLAAVEVNGCILVDGIQGKALLRSGSGSAGPQVTSFNPFLNDIEAVRGQETEYCTMNPLTNAQGVTLSDGNLKCTWPSDGDGESVAGTLEIPMGIPGKFYWELDTTAGTGGGLDFGIVRSDQKSWMDGTLSNRLFNQPEFAGLLGNSGSFRNKTGIDADVSSYLSATANGSSQTFMVCVDALEGKIWIGKDGEWGNNNGEGNPALGLFPATANLYNDKQYSYLPVHMGSSDSGTSTTVWNFGQKPFKFAPPEGFQPLNAANIRPSKTISRPDQYVGIVTYTGAGATKTVTGLNFDTAPDLIWLKNRDRASYGDGTAAHFFCYDSVRGTGTSKMLTITTTEQQGSKSTEADLDAFVRNGFTLDAASGTDCINNDGDDFWACCWRAGGGKGGGGFFKDGEEFASAAAMNMSAGALNNYVQTSVWSDNLSGAVAGDPYQATKMFDGKFNTECNHNAINSSMTWTQTLTNVTKLRVFVHVGSDYATLTTTGTGGVQVDIIPANYGPEWYDIPLGITGNTINSIKFTRRGSGAFFDIYAVEVNGAVYVDNGVTAPNVPAIAPTAASVGTKQGFSIIQYSGDSNDGSAIPHGLNQKPDFAVIKALNKTDDWRVYHSGLGNRYVNALNSRTNSTGYNWRNVTDKGFFLQSDSAINTGYNYIAYLWHNVPGLQKFGVYKGTGSADGAYVELGFRPAVFMCRCTSSNGDWWNIFDSNRKTSNPSTPYLEYGDAARAEQTANLVDFLSNGVKFRFGTGNQLNGSDQSYIYMAWAESPSIDLFGGGSNAF